MKKLTSHLGIIMLILLCTSLLFAQSAEQLYQQGLMKEQGEGDLMAAIDIYTSLINNENATRELKANTLLHLGLCYEKIGKADAIKSYRQLLSQYPDQVEAIKLAQQRLMELEDNLVITNGTLKKPNFTQVPLNMKVHFGSHPLETRHFDVSPDGKEFVIQSEGLTLADISGSVMRKLFTPPDRDAHPIYSPNGKYLAFTREKQEGVQPNEKYSIEICVVTRNGEDFRILKSGLKGREGRSIIWNHKSDQVNYISSNGFIVSINLSGREVKRIPIQFQKFDIGLSEMSPNGKWISYQNGQAIWLISSDGNENFKLINSSDFNGFATFNENGDALYFVSNKNSENNIWKININATTGKRSGKLTQVTFYNNMQILYPRKIRGTSKLAFITLQKNKPIHLVDAENPNNYKVLANGSSAIFSPDEKHVYYLDLRAGHKGIYRVPSSQGMPELLTSTHPEKEFRVSPDGQYIAFFNLIDDNKKQLQLLNLKGKQLKILTSFDYTPSKVAGWSTPEWSPDSKTLAFAKGNEVFTIDIESGIKSLLANIELEAWTLRWSPDGTYISGLAYIEDEPQNHGILISATTGKIKRITPPEEKEYKEGLEWHPNSKRLTYMYYSKVGDRDGLREAYVDGSPTKHFIDQPDIWDYLGNWSPDGKSFYFGGAWDKGFNLYRYDEETKKTHYVSGEDPGTEVSGLVSISKDGKKIIRCGELWDFKMWIMDNVN